MRVVFGGGFTFFLYCAGSMFRRSVTRKHISIIAGTWKKEGKSARRRGDSSAYMYTNHVVSDDAPQHLAVGFSSSFSSDGNDDLFIPTAIVTRHNTMHAVSIRNNASKYPAFSSVCLPPQELLHDHFVQATIAE